MDKKINRMNKACQAYLQKLCLEIPQRPVGSAGNQQAVNFLRKQLTRWGWEIESIPFLAVDWKEAGADLTAAGQHFTVYPGPYSRGVQVEAALVSASTMEELEAADPQGKLLLLTGALTREQLMPKNFPFYNPEHHQRFIALLEARQPAAILAATDKNAALAGGISRFPLIEDGDFEIPSLYMTGREGQRLLKQGGQTVMLHSRAERIPSSGEQLVGRKPGSSQEMIVLSAHVDAKLGTPGALDNATGVSVLLLLAERLQQYQGSHALELVLFNGEDYFGANGQLAYLEQREGQFQQMLLNINIDGAGYHQGGTVFSPMDCPESLLPSIHKTVDHFEKIFLGGPWVQGDHSIFLQHGVPALAVTSSWFLEHLEDQTITHTPRDHPGVVNCQRVVEISLALEWLIRDLSQQAA